MKLYELWRVLPVDVTIHLEDLCWGHMAIAKDAITLPHRYTDREVYYVMPTSSTELTVRTLPPDDD